MISEYKIRNLGDIAEVIRGTTITRREVTEGKIPVIAGGQTPSCFHNIANRIGKTITVSASGAYAGFVQYFETPIFASDCSTIKVIDEKELNTKFLYYMLLSVQTEIYGFQRGTGQPHVYPSQLVNLQVPIPFLNEQLKIVEILEDHLSRLDAALADVKQAKLKAAQFRVSFLRSIFKGDETWATVKLKDVGKWQGGGTPSKSNSSFWTDGVIPWISPKDMGPSEIWTTQDLITEDAVMNSTVNKVDANSIVMVVRSGILERILPIALTRMVSTMNQDMKALTVNSDLMPKFAFYSLFGFEQDILQKCRKTGTTVASIKTEALMNYEIKVPTKVIQQSILEFVESQVSLLDATVTPINMIAKTGENLRRSLLQAAFTGQLTKEEVNV